ncbi:MAG: ABC transporter ATP-binding protein [Lachnospiraceae bacterium]|nr:ABC transporter ATP-binding protein [Lachnospiraceae bacterium]
MRIFWQRLIKIVGINTKSYVLNQIKCFLCLIIYTLSSITFPSFLSKIVDLGIMTNNIKNIVLYVSEMLVCGVLMVIFYYLQRIYFFKFGNEIVLGTKQKLYKKLNIVDIGFWDEYKVGDVLTILDNDIERLQELLTSNISELVVNLFLCIGISFYIILLNAKIGIIVLVLAFLFALIQRKVANKSKEKMKKLRMTMGDFNSFSTETINNMPALQMTGKNNYITKLYADKCRALATEGLDFTKTMSAVGMTGMAFNVIAIIIVLIIGALDVANNKISVGLLFSMTIYVQRLYSPIVSMGNMFVKIKNFFPLLDNIYNVMYNEDNVIKGSYKSKVMLNGEISFENVWFSYNEENYILKGFTESFHNGQVTGIVGKNGSGKTTIIRLLTKLCSVEKGKIEIDGIDIKKFDLEYLQEQIGVMTQDNFLLGDELNSILQDEKQLEKMKKFFAEMNFSESGEDILSGKFSVNENNLNISGGEAQKLALYKLYLDNKPICILDEPTAALDSESEEKMIGFIKEHFDKKTLIIITHKPKILGICDKIIELNYQ